ncbi:MAG: hypothetical protein R3E53_21575 [Myxococcota bacterium]
MLATGLVALASRRLGERREGRGAHLPSGLTAYLLLGIVVNRLVVDDVRRRHGLGRPRAHPHPRLPHRLPALAARLRRAHGAARAGRPAQLVGGGLPELVVHPRPAPDPGLAILRARWPVQLLEWFADGDVGVFVERTETGRRVRFEDLRYAWASRRAAVLGRWWLDARDRPLGAIEKRFERARGSARTT